MYNSEKLIWVKNVKRNQGDRWAYEDIELGKTFWLNWPSSKKMSASTPNVGDIIMLFQKPNILNGKKNYLVHMTHLVSPVSDIVYHDDLHLEHRWCREVLLIAKATPIFSIPNPGYFNFFKPNRGLTNPIKNVTNNINLTEFQVKNEIWKLFSKHMYSNVNSHTPDDNVSFLPFTVSEGENIISKHVKLEYRSRNSQIVLQAKKIASDKNGGRLKCECCNFDFFESYGLLGVNFIECHHKIHVSAGPRKTRIEDLAMVCSNCHSMLHRRLENQGFPSVVDLKEVIANIKTR